MKVAILGSAYPYRGGLAAYNERLAREFIAQGDEVTIYTFTVQYPDILFPGVSQYSDEQAPEGLEIHRVLNSVSPLSWWRTVQMIKKGKYDLFISKFWIPFMGPSLGTVARGLRSSKQTTRISILDNVVPHEKRLGDRPLTSYYVASMQGFVAMSQKVYDDLSEYDTDKPRILSPHPMFDNFGKAVSQSDAQTFLGLDTSYHYILFFGFIRKYKGLDILLEAMSDPRFEGRKIRLIVAGEFYDNPAPYLDIIEEYGLQDRVVLYDKFITDQEVKYYFCASDLVVQPYKSATQSGVTQIAYHFEKPMIVTDVGGLSDLCPDGRVGYVVEPNAQQISDAIFKFYDMNKEKVFEENIKVEKKRYTWDILVQNIKKLKQEISDEK